MVAPPTIDVHTHLAPLFGSSEAPDGVAHTDDGCVIVEGHRVGLPGLYDASALAAAMAGYGVDAAWVSAPPPFYRQGLDAGATDQWVRSLDTGMRARIADQPALGLLTYLPLDHPEVALALAQNAARDPQVVGWTGSAGGGSLCLHDELLAPLWALLEKAGRPILLHPGESRDVRLGDFYLSNLVGNPVESGVAAAHLVFGGVLSRHPALKVVLVHCGGIVPGLVGRWSRGVSTSRPGVSEDTADPRVAVRSLWVDALAHDPRVLDLAIAVIGVDHVVLGSDYPFPMGVGDPLELLAHLPTATRERIAGNAARLLGAHA